jgi:hypothetical protein
MPTAIQLAQQKLGVSASGRWDAATSGALLAYQASGHGPYPMQPTGHADPATLLNLGYYGATDALTDEWVAWMRGGNKPGTFWRDARASIDQVPQWAWATLAVGFGAFAYMAYRTDKKRGK